MKTKRKTVRAAASGKKPTLPPKPIVSDLPIPLRKQLTYLEDKFCLRYIENGGNATDAARLMGYAGGSACEMGSRLLRKVEIQEAIEFYRGEMERNSKCSLEQIIRGLIAQAFTSPADLAAIASDPLNEERYSGLGDKALAAELVPTEYGYKIKGPTASDRRAAYNDLVKLLGLAKNTDPGIGSSEPGEFLHSLAKLFKPTGEGS
jgi:hypothetical protein